MGKQLVVTFAVSREELDQLEWLCQELGTNKSVTLRRILKDAVLVHGIVNGSFDASLKPPEDRKIRVFSKEEEEE